MLSKILFTLVRGSSDIVCYDADSCGKLVTPHHGCRINQNGVNTWPSATRLQSHRLHNLLKTNEGLGTILVPGAHHKKYH